MKNKKILKRGIALFCAAAILIGGIAILATNSKAETVAEQLAADGYTAVTPETFGITEETVYRNQEDVTLSKTYSSSTNAYEYFDAKYLDADLYLPTAGYEKGDVCYMGKYVFRIYIVGSALTLYSPKTGSLAAVTLVQAKLSDYDIAAGEYFNLKLATDLSVNSSNSNQYDIKVQMWINDKAVMLTTDTITRTTGNLAKTPLRVTLSGESKTIKIKPPTATVGDTSTVSPKLDGYTKITPETFGIDAEVLHTYAGTTINQAYTGNTSLLDTTTYFDAEVSLTSTATALTGGYIGYLNDNFLRIYIMDTTLTVYSLPGSNIIYQTDLSALGITAGDYFNLRLATNMTDNTTDTANTDVAFQMWINGSLIVPQTSQVTVADTFAGGTNLYVGLAETGTIKVKPVGWVEPEEPDVPVDPNLPEELIGYTKVTPENFGITEEFVYDTVEQLYVGEGVSKWADITDFNHTYFNADIALTDTQATNVNAGFGYLNKYMFRFYISGTTLVVYTLQEECAGILYQVNLSDFEITAGEYFNLKFATDIVDNASDSSKSDVKVQMWLNGTKATATKDTITIGDAYATSNYINMTLAEEGTIKIRPAVVEDSGDSEDTSDPLYGYTKITPENFGITEEVIHTYDSTAISKTYGGTTSMLDKNTYFEADVSLTAAALDTGYIAYLNKYFLRIYVSGDAITVTSPAASYQVLFQTKLSSLDGTVGEYFHLKFATSMTNNANDSGNTDVTVQMWVNDNKVSPLSTDSNIITVSDAHAGGTNLYVGLSTAGTIKIKPHVDEVVDPENPDEPVVPDEPVDPDLPEELVDYTKVTPQYFGISKPAVHVYGTNNSGTYASNGSKSFEKAYFEADIALPKATLDTGYIAYLNQYLFRFYMTSTTFVIYSPNADENGCDPIVYQENLSTLGISAGEYFNLKFATDMVDNASDTALTDITVQIWINDTKVTPDVATVTVTDGHASGQSLYVKLTTDGTIKVKTHVEVSEGEGERLSDVAYELSSTSGYLLTGSGDLFLDGVSTDVGTTLTLPGDYVLQRVVSPTEIYIQNVSLYKVGDVNLGGGDEWTADDQGELERIIKYGTTSTAAMKAADINNDGKVAKSDLTLIKKVVKGELTKSEVMDKYHTPKITYDFLGGDSVMPIGGYYGPYNAQNITESVYKAIAQSGINLIVKSEMDYANEDTRALLEKGLEYAEKYGIGVYVYDTRLNPITASNNIVSAHNYVSDNTELATLLGDYSRYQSYLGNMIVDEPIANIEDGWTSWDENLVSRYKWYKGITTALNSYDNHIGYVNLLGQYHMQRLDGTKYIDSYETYLRIVGKGMKLLSFDSYPFYEEDGVSGGLTPYLKSLGTTSKVAREDGYPFWSYIQAGTDFRDDSSDGATTGYLTQAQTLWNVNTSLAFGAKGIVYFPLLQPTYYAKLDSTTGTYDYNRNGIFGADNNTNSYYTMVQTANKQVAAVDEVLMKALNQGVIVTGQAAIDAVDVDSIITSTDKLASVSGDDAMVGCFTYQESEAFYVVSYDYAATENQTITLKFDGNHQYRLIQSGTTTYGEGSTCTITASAGEGVLVVLEDYVVYYEDISEYRSESGYTAPEAPAGYIFAGWYKDEACTFENAVKKTEIEVSAYAKFVDAKLLTVKAQITAGTTADSASTSIRFVTSVNDLNYRKAGFLIKIHKDSGTDVRDRVDNVVYKTLTAMVGDTTWKYTPQKLFCGTATYFKAWVIKNVPNANFDTVFEVTPYWETLDGTIVYGTTTNKTVRQGIQ